MSRNSHHDSSGRDPEAYFDLPPEQSGADRLPHSNVDDYYHGHTLASVGKKWGFDRQNADGSWLLRALGLDHFFTGRLLFGNRWPIVIEPGFGRGILLCQFSSPDQSHGTPRRAARSAQHFDKKKQPWTLGKVVEWIARIVLGGVFIYAGMNKILHPAAFAKAIYNYQILPDMAINPAALILPWLELLLGICLITGFFLYGSVFLSNLLLFIFLGAITYNLTRGLNVDCGCFEANGAAVRATTTWWYLLRDSFFLIPSIYLFVRIYYRGRANPAFSSGEIRANPSKLGPSGEPTHD